MSKGRLLSTLVVVALGLTVVELAFADSGSGSGSAVPVASDGSGYGSGSAAPATELPTEVAVLQQAATAYHQKDWFMLAGALLALVIYAVRWVLAKKWPRWSESHYAVFLSAAMAGIGSLAIAWSSNADPASSHTLVGALKLFAFATVAYVVPKKVSQGLKNTGTASSSDVPAP